MNAREWVYTNKGKKIQLITYLMPEHEINGEEIKGILESFNFHDWGFEACIELIPKSNNAHVIPNYPGIYPENLGFVVDNIAFFNYRQTNGTQVRLECALLD